MTLFQTQAFGDGWLPIENKTTTMRVSIQSSPAAINLLPPQDRHIHLRFFDSNTGSLIQNVTFGMKITKENQTLLENAFWTKSGSFTLNLKPAQRYLWSASPDHDPIDGLYYSKGDQIDIDTSYLTRDLYHFEFQPLTYVVGDSVHFPPVLYPGQQNYGIKFETDLDLLAAYNKTISPISELNYESHISSIDGTVSQKGCSIIKGNITAATDIQNSTIQVCNYHDRHFKLVDYDACILIGWEGKITDPKTGTPYDFPLACDIPSTCDPKDSWWVYVMGHPEKLQVVQDGNKHDIIVNYGSEMCASESYNTQEKKMDIIATPNRQNRTNIDVIIPKSLVGNVTSVTVNGQGMIPYVTDYPTSNAIPTCPESCYNVQIQVPYSTTPEKIEIGAKGIPEFPFVIPVLLIGIISLIVFGRIRFGR
jgi:hypothetical protein